MSRREATDDELEELLDALLAEFSGSPMALDPKGDLAVEAHSVNPRAIHKKRLFAWCAARGFYPQDFTIEPAHFLRIKKPVMVDPELRLAMARLDARPPADEPSPA